MRHLIIAAALAISCILPNWSKAQGADRPNVVVIMLDDARTDDMNHFPGLLAIKEQGANFPNTYAPYPLCCPSRATFLTGQYAHNHGVLSNARPTGGFWLFKDAETLATWLDPFYVTGWIGKYLNEYGTNGSAAYVPPGWNVWRVPDGSVWNYASTRWSIDGALTSLITRYQTDAVTEYARQFINAYAGGEAPFFLVVSILAPHAGNPPESDDPSFPTPNVGTRYRNARIGTSLPGHPAFNANDPAKPIRLSAISATEAQGLREVHQQRLESMLYAEDAVEAIIAALQANGVLHNTYVLLLSDNGYFMGEYRIRSGKIQPYDISAKVPLFIRGPSISPGTVVLQPVGLHDIAPTILAMTGLTGAQGGFRMDGMNILPFIADRTLQADRALILEGGEPNGQLVNGSPYVYHGVRTPRWKYIERTSGAKELYDLANDPYELRNRADFAGFTVVQLQMKRLLERYKFCRGTACW